MFARFFSTRERSNFIAVILLHRQRSSQSRAPSTTVRSLRELQWSPSPAIAVAEKCARPLVTAASPAMTTRNCIAAMRLASGSSFTLAKKACLERTGGDVFASQRCLCSPKEGGGAPNGAPIPVAAPRCGRRGRGPISGTARLSALLRGHAPGTPTRPGPRFLEPPDANGRTLSGTSAASTSQSGTRRTG